MDFGPKGPSECAHHDAFPASQFSTYPHPLCPRVLFVPPTKNGSCEQRFGKQGLHKPFGTGTSAALCPGGATGEKKRIPTRHLGFSYAYSSRLLQQSVNATVGKGPEEMSAGCRGLLVSHRHVEDAL